MDKFVKGENGMWKMPVKKRIQTRIVSASAVKRALPLTWRCSGKKETPINYYAAIILNYRNVAKELWREPKIIKFENAIDNWINIGHICESTLSAMSFKTKCKAPVLKIFWILKSLLTSESAINLSQGCPHFCVCGFTFQMRNSPRSTMWK